MIVEDQSEAIALLSSPATYGAGVTEVERVDTHISHVFLAGARAYKLKRAVRFPYVDFSTAELRRRNCEAEIAVNRRTAPELYIGVVPITRAADGALGLAGSGPAVDWVVEMVRFDQEALFDRLARRGALTEVLMEAVADATVRLHAEAEPCPDRGGRAGMEWVVSGNAVDLGEHAGRPFSPEAVARYQDLAEAVLAGHSERLETRRLDGHVRRCHGDLHLGNICLIEGRPRLFDAIEFNDDIACCDVLYDFAFLVMDVLHRGLHELANLAFNRYLARADDYDGLVLFPFFLSCRAAVRAKTTATAADQAEPAHAERLRAEATRYLDDARAYLEPGQARLIAVGGVSGTGKSTLARTLAPGLGAAPGAVVVRSDVLRKRLFDVEPDTRLGPEAYTEEVSRRVYDGLQRATQAALSAGLTVIVDAVFGRPEQRAAVASVAAAAGAPFTGLWLEAPHEALLARLRTRPADASDADVAVLEQQLARDVGPLDWRRVDASGPPADVRRRVVAALGQGAP